MPAQKPKKTAQPAPKGAKAVAKSSKSTPKPASATTAKKAMPVTSAKANAKPAPKVAAKAAPAPAAKTPAKPAAKPATKVTAKAPAKPMAKTAAKPAAKPAAKVAAKPLVAAKTPVKAPAKAPVKAASAKPPAKPAAKTTPTAKGKAPVKGKGPGLADDLPDLEAEFAEETPAAAGEKVKPLRMKISKAKERALMKEFGLDETILSEEDLAKRRLRLKTLIKMGKTRGYLTHGEISDHLPDKLVDAETMEVVITMVNDMGVAVYEQTPDAETLLITNTGPTVASEEEAEE